MEIYPKILKHVLKYSNLYIISSCILSVLKTWNEVDMNTFFENAFIMNLFMSKNFKMKLEIFMMVWFFDILKPSICNFVIWFQMVLHPFPSEMDGALFETNGNSGQRGKLFRQAN
jgi:hypothetical protein